LPDANHEPFLLVDERLETPPYRQIAEQLRGAIESGSLAAGALLPTVRQLAGDLRIAPNTVARAYTDMQAEGWIVSDGRRGTRVADRAPESARAERREGLQEAAERFVRGLRQRGFSAAEIAGEITRVTGGAS
jgi:GntR family transcriptional regulator